MLFGMRFHCDLSKKKNAVPLCVGVEGVKSSCIRRDRKNIYGAENEFIMCFV